MNIFVYCYIFTFFNLIFLNISWVLVSEGHIPDGVPSSNYSLPVNNVPMNTISAPANSIFTADFSSVTNNTNQNKLPPHVIIPLTIIPFEKKAAERQASTFIDTEYGLTIAPSLTSANSNSSKIDILSKALLSIRDDVINTAKKEFAIEVKKRCSNQCDSFLDPGFNAIIHHGNSRTIFHHLSEKYGNNCVDFVRFTSTIFLSPLILDKAWITTLKVTIENKYRFTFAKIEAYDSPRCENTIRMIAHKNIKNTVDKWYSNFLAKYGCKLLTKKPKGIECIVATIAINHPKFDGLLPSSYIYLVKAKCTFNDDISLTEKVDCESGDLEKILLAESRVNDIGKSKTCVSLLFFYG